VLCESLATTFGVHLMAAPEDRRSPLAVALEWVSRITAVALMMVLPGLLGYWLDRRFETRFLTPVGFVFGVVVAVWSLLLLTGAISGKSGRAKGSRPGKNQEDEQS
jgi:hypothetical protein